MADELKKLLENEILSDETKTLIKEAWESKIESIREEVTAEVRDEFSQKFERDKNEIVQAMDMMIKENLETHIKELSDEKKAVAEERVRAKKSIQENAKKFDEYAKSILESELKEFSEDRKAVAENLKKFDQYIADSVKEVMVDIAQEKKRLAEDRVEHKIKSKKELAETKQRLIEESATAAQEIIESVLQEELTQLKDELKAAKENNLGRKIFEAFSAEFMTHFYNQDKTAKDLLKAIEERDQKIEEAASKIAKFEDTLKEAREETRKATARIERMKVMESLLAPLGGEKRQVMEELLEKVPNVKLQEAFNKYLPSLMEDGFNASRKRVLSESSDHLREVTGDKTVIDEGVKTEAKDATIDDIVGRYNKINTSLKIKNRV